MSILAELTNGREVSEGDQSASIEQEIRATLEAQCDLRAGVVELRAFICDGSIQSGYYNNLDKLAKDAARLDASGSAESICITLNPAAESLLFRSANRLHEAEETTADKDVVSRRWLMVDCDPVREKHTNSTDAEHAAALNKALAVREWLAELGWPQPALADSGNGAHLLYRVDLPNDPEAKELVRRVLKAIAARFSDSEVEIDKSVSNAARLVRLYGTTNRKGQDTQERPQRTSRLFWEETPKAFVVVTAEQLQALIATAEEKAIPKELKGGLEERRTWGALNPDLVQIFLSQGRKNDRGIYEMRGRCHNGKGESALCYDPATGAGWCNDGCDNVTIRRAFGLPDHCPDTRKARTADAKPIKKDELVRLAAAAELFCEPDSDKAYATVPVKVHYETYSINSNEFRLWLTNKFYANYEEAVSSQPMQDAINTLTAKAYYEGKRHKVFTRIGEADGRLYYDLGDECWRVVEIDAEGWRVLDKSPVKFVRPTGYKAQVTPVRGGHLNELRRFINVASDDDWVLFVGWLLGCFLATGPYAILSLAGTQDAAKSTTTKMVRLLVDPSKALVRAQPKEERDLMVGAKNNWLLAFDNLSHIPEWLSDALCRVTTGGGQANRENYTNGKEYLFDVMRPVIMNGIEELATRPDLADRTINVFLPSLRDEQRKDERTLYAEYEEALPRILGALFDVLAAAIKSLPHTHREKWPRIVEVAKLVTAAEGGLGWSPDTFLTAYEQYRRTARINALEASNIGTAVLSLMENEARWEGSATELLNKLEYHLPPTARRANFPASARGMSNALRRLIPSLKEDGIEVDMPEGARRGADGKVARKITLTNTTWRRPTTDELKAQIDCGF